MIRTLAPAKSIVMLRLRPEVGIGQQSGALLKSSRANAISIRSESSGRLLISSSMSRNIPVTVSLYGINGRTLIDRVRRTLEAGNTTGVFGGNTLSRGVYLVKITGAGVNLLQQVVVAR